MIFRYDDFNHQITVCYLRCENEAFARFEFKAIAGADEPDVLQAHLVDTKGKTKADTYQVSYKFYFSGTWLKQFTIEGVGSRSQNRVIWKRV